jgi:hypothetical protein
MDMFDLAFEHSMSLFRDRFRAEQRSNPWGTLYAFLEAASLAGDAAALGEASDMAKTLPASSWRERTETWIDTLLAVIGREADAPARVQQLLTRLESERLRIHATSLLVAAARALPPGDPARDEFATEARRLATAAGADGIARWVDRAVT